MTRRKSPIPRPESVKIAGLTRARLQNAAPCCLRQIEQWQLLGAMSGPVISNRTPRQRQLPWRTDIFDLRVQSCTKDAQRFRCTRQRPTGPHAKRSPTGGAVSSSPDRSIKVVMGRHLAEGPETKADDRDAESIRGECGPMHIMQSLLRRMFGQPRGLYGKLGGIIMARANDACGAWVTELLNVASNETVLEVGFGPGTAIRRLSAMAAHVAGVD